MIISLLWKTTFIYFLVLITLRLMGKREIGQLSLFDFVVLLLIADVSAIFLDGNKSIISCVIPVLVLAIIQKILAFLSLKINFVRKIVDGEESIIIMNGVLDIKEMKKQNYNMDDLITQLRLKNVKSLSQVQHLILENNGEISVFLYNEEKPSIKVKSKLANTFTGNSSSYRINYANNESQNYSIFPCIISGQIQNKNIKIFGLKEEWIKKEVKKQGHEIETVYYASYEEGKLFIMKTK